MKFASNMLMVLLYAQGLLGFAGLTTVVLKDWAYSEPTFVNGIQQMQPRQQYRPPAQQHRAPPTYNYGQGKTRSNSDISGTTR